MSGRDGSEREPLPADAARLAFGMVVGVDGARARAQLRLDRHGIVTRWLRVIQPAASGARAYTLPRIGSFALALLDGRLTNGVIVGALYADALPPPAADPLRLHLTADDGAVFEHDPGASICRIEIPASGTFTIRVGRSQIAVTDAAIALHTPRFEAERA